LNGQIHIRDALHVVNTSLTHKWPCNCLPPESLAIRVINNDWIRRSENSHKRREFTEYPGCQLSSIEKDAFSECKSLSFICFPPRIGVIREYCFHHCSSLLAVTFESNSIYSWIEVGAFQMCSELSSVYLPSSIELRFEAWVQNASGNAHLFILSHSNPIRNFVIFKVTHVVDVNHFYPFVSFHRLNGLGELIGKTASVNALVFRPSDSMDIFRRFGSRNHWDVF
jgi:hypothetical protein